MNRKVNLDAAFSRFDDHWNPRVVAELNSQLVKIAKVKGEFDWHFHADEDEMFLVHRGQLELQWRDASGYEHSERLTAGEFFVVARGVQHRPVAADEVEIVLFEPATTLNTGNLTNDLTRNQLERLD